MTKSFLLVFFLVFLISADGWAKKVRSSEVLEGLPLLSQREYLGLSNEGRHLYVKALRRAVVELEKHHLWKTASQPPRAGLFWSYLLPRSQADDATVDCKKLPESWKGEEWPECIYAGYIIEHECSTAGKNLKQEGNPDDENERLKLTEKGKTTKILSSCPGKYIADKTVACNPLIFGLDKDRQVFCVGPQSAKLTNPNAPSGPSSECQLASNNEDAIDVAARLILENPEYVNDYKVQFSMMCHPDGIACNPKQINKTDLQKVCRIIQDRMEADVAQAVKLKGGKGKTTPTAADEPPHEEAPPVVRKGHTI